MPPRTMWRDPWFVGGLVTTVAAGIVGLWACARHVGWL